MRDVFLRLFKQNEEAFFLFWKDIPIRFRYARDLYDNFNELLSLIWLIQKEEKGTTTVTLSNQLLKIDLICEWDKDLLTLQGNFQAHEFLYDSYASTLNKYPILKISKATFLAEWKTLLQQLITAIKASNCTIEDGIERRRLEVLERTTNAIKNYGVIYEK